jgi:hypothetical protein
MQVLIALLIGAFILGGTALGRWIRDRPPVLLTLCTLAAASYYTLRVTL